MPGVQGPEPVYVAARKILLDALEVLGPHRKAVVLVGAQAIYMHIGEGDLAVAPYTTDGDLTIDPRLLSDRPELPKILGDAGFELAVHPGTWCLDPDGTRIDFLVPASMAGPGRRGARLGVHGTEVARKAKGLEAALVDNAIYRISAFEPQDLRAFDIRVAGIAALLVAKMHKIADRKDSPERLSDKDGLDVLRLLRYSDMKAIGNVLTKLSGNPVSEAVTKEARQMLTEFFADHTSVGAKMAAQACSGLEDEATITLSCEVLSRRLLKMWS